MIFDASGQIVYIDNLSNRLDQGTHEVSWDGRTNQGKLLSPGVYFSMIKFNDGSSEKEITRINKVVIIND